MAFPLRLNGTGRGVATAAGWVAVVALLWWRMGRLEDQVQALTAAVVALEVRLGPAHIAREGPGNRRGREHGEKRWRRPPPAGPGRPGGPLPHPARPHHPGCGAT